MKEFKGTPGPWFRGGSKPMTYSDCVYDPSGLTLLEVYSPDLFEHDANLIAAAPELLEALQEMVAIVKKNTYPQPDKPSSTWGRMEAAEEVIAKALGEK